MASRSLESPRKNDEKTSDGVLKEKNNESIPAIEIEIEKYLFILFCIQLNL
jgi:hypothetical protein